MGHFRGSGKRNAAPDREYPTAQKNAGTAMALRKGAWKYVPGAGGPPGARRRRPRSRLRPWPIAICRPPGANYTTWPTT